MSSHAGMQTNEYIHEDSGKAGSPSTDAETLLRALRNVIIPLVRRAHGEYKPDSNQYALRPEGEEFVIALQKFMLSFLHSQRGPMGGVEVELKEKEADIPNAGSSASITSDDDLSPKGVAYSPSGTKSLPVIPALKENTTIQECTQAKEGHNEEFSDRSVVASRVSVNIEDPDAVDQQRSRYIEKALIALREHVFNVMPIRLLCFKPQASKLQITLIERGAIYTQIAPTLKATINKLDTFPPNFDEREPDEEVIARLIRDCSKYAILSHTWLRGSSGEVVYGDWNGGELDARQPGYRKLVNFCKVAWEDHGVAFGWMDTICINKESSAELDESIRSMYKWYSGAHICIAYLADTVTLSDMVNDSWFTRGWTLQELLAPWHIKFYNTHWNKLVDSTTSDKHDSVICQYIERATAITKFELEGPLAQVSLSRRMRMAAKRQVTREEDSAYCLMGIFDVSMSIAYGEGSERAFSRLLQEILNSPSNTVDLFNWAGMYSARISALLPPTLQGYLYGSTDAQLEPWGTPAPIEPMMLTHLGLRITVVLMPAISTRNPPRKCTPIGDYHATVNISSLVTDFGGPKVVNRGTYSILDARISENDRWKEDESWHRLRFGVLNATRDTDQTILVPKHCIAVGLQYYMNTTYRIFTEAPTVFTLDNKSIPYGGEPANYLHWTGCYSIGRSELESHGMKLATVYL